MIEPFIYPALEELKCHRRYVEELEQYIYIQNKNIEYHKKEASARAATQRDFVRFALPQRKLSRSTVNGCSSSSEHGEASASPSTTSNIVLTSLRSKSIGEDIIGQLLTITLVFIAVCRVANSSHLMYTHF